MPPARRRRRSTVPRPVNDAVPSGGTIAAINVIGNRRIEADTITSYMVVQVGEPFDPQAINESLKTLYATGLFSSVRSIAKATTSTSRWWKTRPSTRSFFPATRS